MGDLNEVVYVYEYVMRIEGKERGREKRSCC